MRTLWRSLTGRLAFLQVGFLLAAIVAIAFTGWVSWQLEGGAAAVNEAGRLRMMSYRMALLHRQGDTAELAAQMTQFETALGHLRDGDPARPLFIPDDPDCREAFGEVQQSWAWYRAALLRPYEGVDLHQEADGFVAGVDRFVSTVEHAIASRTALLGLLGFTLIVLVIGAAIAAVLGAYMWIVQPLQQLRAGLADMARRDFSVRVDEQNSVEEFGSLARGFNQMADALSASYRGLEDKVAEKTASLASQNERLAALYDVTLMATQTQGSLEELGEVFADKIARIARADAAAVRIVAEDGQRVMLLGSARLPQAMLAAERCLRRDECACAAQFAHGDGAVGGARVIPIRQPGWTGLRHCEAAGYQAVVAVPIRVQARAIGEVDLFFYAERPPGEADGHLLEALAGHFGAVVENVRLAARLRESAVSEERTLLAQELHDSIAQSLAFLKIQVQLLRSAVDGGDRREIEQAIDEIDTGVRESYADVRELLVHFRTRAGHEDIEHAIRTTLSKFEHQTGLPTALLVEGAGVPLPPDRQVQVLHILQEALSNVRKHAGASRVEVRVEQAPAWRFEVRDDGVGFDPETGAPDETHVGLRIMRERAQRIGAEVVVDAAPGRHRRRVDAAAAAGRGGRGRPGRRRCRRGDTLNRALR